jgi:hypothetical protein
MVSTGGSGTSSGRPPDRVTAGQRTAARGRWDLGAGDAESVLAEARKAFFIMVGFLVCDRRRGPAKPDPAAGTAGLNFPGTTRRPGGPGGSAP